MNQQQHSDQQPQQLARTLSLPMMVFYGTGTILGAGVYVLTGKVAAEAGIYAPWAFVLAAVIAAFSGFSYARLSRRFPVSAGPAVYVHQTFGFRNLATVVGWAIVATGVVSAATMARGFVGYLHVMIDLPATRVIIFFVAALTLLSISGISHAVRTAAVITTIEVIGILFVITVAAPSAINNFDSVSELIPPLEWPVLASIGIGAYLAFYAYIGFEDIVNMAEEVHRPEVNLSRAIYFSLAITTLLYLVVALVAVLALPIDELAASHAPFATLVEKNSDAPVALIGIISLIAVTNGALVQIIMGSRVLYGMSRQQMAPAFFGSVLAKTRTPHLATLVVGSLVLVFALWLPITTLAKATSSIILMIFTLVNLAQCRQAFLNYGMTSTRGVIEVIIPAKGALLCLGFMALQLQVLTTH